jgi:hypothetical protein
MGLNHSGNDGEPDGYSDPVSLMARSSYAIVPVHGEMLSIFGPIASIDLNEITSSKQTFTIPEIQIQPINYVRIYIPGYEETIYMSYIAPSTFLKDDMYWTYAKRSCEV